MNTNTKDETMTALLIRKDTKQAWTSAAKQAMKDSFEKLSAWATGMNEQLGWNKYAVEAPTGAAVNQVPVK